MSSEALTDTPLGAATSPAPRHRYEVTARDGVFAAVLLVVGYAWWDWVQPRSQTVPLPNTADGGGVIYKAWPSGVGVAAFFVLALGVSIAYYRLSGVRLSRTAWLGAAALLVATGPFVLYTPTPFHVLLGMGVTAGFVMWHALVSRSAAGGTFGVALVATALNQVIAPFRNIGAWWAGLSVGLRGRHRSTQVVATIVALVVAAPVILLVIWLLSAADAGFAGLVQRLTTALANLNIGRVFWQCVFAIPFAIFAAALLYANARHSGEATVPPDALSRAGRTVQKAPAVALAAPLALLDLIYVVFFVAMGSYLFSAFAGRLPAGYTYADYARRGFFELAGVAALNALVLAVTYAIAARGDHGLPKVLKVCGAVLSGLTLLLIATAVSKMVMYVNQYGLTLLRLMTLAGLAVLAVLFGLVLARHFHRFDVSRPVFAVLVVALVGLAWANPSGLIARYNIDRYLNGGIAQVDVAYLADNLGDASVPALADLAARAPSSQVAQQAAQALTDYAADAQPVADAGGVPWMAWTWQLAHAWRIAGVHG